MSKRLQVIMSDEEYVAMEHAADQEELTISEFVREAIREARRRRSGGSAEQKLKAIALAMTHEFPVGDVDEMLREIEAGRA